MIFCRAGVHDSLRENSLYCGALGFTDAHLIGVVARRRRADGEGETFLEESALFRS